MEGFVASRKSVVLKISNLIKLLRFDYFSENNFQGREIRRQEDFCELTPF